MPRQVLKLPLAQRPSFSSNRVGVKTLFAYWRCSICGNNDLKGRVYPPNGDERQNQRFAAKFFNAECLTLKSLISEGYSWAH